MSNYSLNEYKGTDHFWFTPSGPRIANPITGRRIDVLQDRLPGLTLLLESSTPPKILIVPNLWSVSLSPVWIHFPTHRHTIYFPDVWPVLRVDRTLPCRYDTPDPMWQELPSILVPYKSVVVYVWVTVHPCPIQVCYGLRLWFKSTKIIRVKVGRSGVGLSPNDSLLSLHTD